MSTTAPLSLPSSTEQLAFNVTVGSIFSIWSCINVKNVKAVTATIQPNIFACWSLTTQTSTFPTIMYWVGPKPYLQSQQGSLLVHLQIPIGMEQNVLSVVSLTIGMSALVNVKAVLQDWSLILT